MMWMILPPLKPLLSVLVERALADTLLSEQVEILTTLKRMAAVLLAINLEV
jgi:hypothetical protein